MNIYCFGRQYIGGADIFLQLLKLTWCSSLLNKIRCPNIRRFKKTERLKRQKSRRTERQKYRKAERLIMLQIDRPTTRQKDRQANNAIFIPDKRMSIHNFGSTLNCSFIGDSKILGKASVPVYKRELFGKSQKTDQLINSLIEMRGYIFKWIVATSLF